MHHLHSSNFMCFMLARMCGAPGPKLPNIKSHLNQRSHVPKYSDKEKTCISEIKSTWNSHAENTARFFPRDFCAAWDAAMKTKDSFVTRDLLLKLVPGCLSVSC